MSLDAEVQCISILDLARDDPPDEQTLASLLPLAALAAYRHASPGPSAGLVPSSLVIVIAVIRRLVEVDHAAGFLTRLCAAISPATGLCRANELDQVFGGNLVTARDAQDLGAHRFGIAVVLGCNVPEPGDQCIGVEPGQPSDELYIFRSYV